MTAHIDDSFNASATAGPLRRLTRLWGKWRDWRRQRADERARRAALEAIKDHDAWIYHDLGISQADVEWASHQPLHVDAGRELERLRARSAMGR